MQEAKSAQNQRYRATKREIKLLDDANERASDIVINMEYDQTTLQADIRQLQEDKAALEEQLVAEQLAKNAQIALVSKLQLDNAELQRLLDVERTSSEEEERLRQRAESHAAHNRIYLRGNRQQSAHQRNRQRNSSGQFARKGTPKDA